MNTFKRKLTAILLTFAMLFSLMPAMPQAAEAATTATSNNEMFSFSYDLGLKTLNIEVKDTDGQLLDTLTVDNFLANSIATFKLNNKDYQIVSVQAADNLNANEQTLYSDRHQYSFSTSIPTLDDSSSLTITVQPYDGPEISEIIYNASATRMYRLYDDQIFKMIYKYGGQVDVNTEIKSITPSWSVEFGDSATGSGSSFNDQNREEDYYSKAFIFNSVNNNLGSVQPYNMESLTIAYSDGNGSEKSVTVPADDLRFTVGEEASAKHYNIELADDSFHIVYFYNEPDGHAGNNYFLYDVKFVNHGQSLGENMPADPTYGNSEYVFVNWDQNSWNGSSHKPLLSTTIVNEDITAFARKASSSSGSTQIHVINSPNSALLNRVAELYNEQENATISATDILLDDSFGIRVYNAAGDQYTNIAYSTNNWGDWNGEDNYYYNISNVVADEVVGVGHNKHISPADIGSIRVYFTLTSDLTLEDYVDIEVGEYAGDLSVYMTDTENIIELYVNQPGEVIEDPNPDPEIQPPTYEELKALIGVTVDCSTDGHDSTTTDLIENTSGKNDSYTLTVDGNTATVTIHNGPYVTRYDEQYEGTSHSLAEDEAQNKTVNLTYANNGWKLADSEEASTTVYFDVVCSGTTPEPGEGITGLTKELVSTAEAAAVAVGTSAGYAFPEHGVVVIPHDGQVTLLYSITVTGDSDASFAVDDTGAALVEVDDINVTEDDDGNFTGSIPEGSESLTFYVAKTFGVSDIENGKLTNTAAIDGVTPDTEETPAEKEPALPDETTLKDMFDVELDCTSGVGHENQTYDLVYREEMFGDIVRDENGTYTVTMTVDGSDYLEQFNVASENIEHQVVGDATKTITLTYDKDKSAWTAPEGSSRIKFDVHCSGTGDYDINNFTKDLIAGESERTTAQNDGVAVENYTIPAEDESVVIPYNGEVTLLYKLTVTGNNDSSVNFVVTDEGAEFVKAVSGVDIEFDENDSTFTGTVPANQSVSFYVSKTFDADDIIDGKLVNEALIAGTGEDEDASVDPGIDDIEEEVGGEEGEPAGTVTITPADLTIYEGGTGGYDAVVDDSGSIVNATDSTSLPHPLFKIEVPDGSNINPETITLMNGDNAWTVVSDGDDLYHFKAIEDGMDSVRVQYTDKTDNHVVTEDEFDATTDSYTEYDIKLYGGQATNAVAITANNRYAVDTSQVGTLTVRAVADEPSDVVNEVKEQAPTEKVATGTAVAVEPKDTKYTLNDTDVEIDPTSIPSLLFDSIIDDDVNRTEMLEDKVDEALGADSDRNYEIKYIDLVDANNGNAWIASSKGTDIYWGYPEGTNENTDFTILHFKGLHRDGETSGFDPKDLEKIDVSNPDQLENVTITKMDEGILFHVDEANFSPYALVWSDDQGSGGNTGGGGTTGGGTTPNPPDLNTEDHFSYVVGYEDGMVKPENAITRAEVASIFYRLLKDDVRDANTTDVSEFSDVSASDWYGTTVATLSAMDIVRGYEDGTFRPNAPITRAEFAAIATRFFEETGAEYEPGTFDDVTGDEWFANAIADAVELGLIGGYPDGTVRPNNNITRAEACAIVNRTLGRIPHVDHLLPADEMTTWPDNNPSDWFYADMQEATNGHEYEWTTEQGQKVEEWTEILDKDWEDR